MLVRAVNAALQANAKTLSWNHLKAHAFSEAESYKMLREAYEGETELASKPDQHAKFLEMLGLAPRVESKTVPQPDIPQTGETGAEVQITQLDQDNEITKGVGQELSPAEVPADEVSSESHQVSDDQPEENTNRAEEWSEAEKTPLAEVPPKPLKKPKAEPIRPFRRKSTRDRTGGPHRENGELRSSR